MRSAHFPKLTDGFAKLHHYLHQQNMLGDPHADVVIIRFVSIKHSERFVFDTFVFTTTDMSPEGVGYMSRAELYAWNMRAMVALSRQTDVNAIGMEVEEVLDDDNLEDSSLSEDSERPVFLLILDGKQCCMIIFPQCGPSC